MTRTIHLVRHAEKQKVKGDPGLTERGNLEAVKTARLFRGRPTDAILSSPLRRAQETAAIIADELNMNYKIDPLLAERANWGDDPEQSFEDFLSMWERASTQRDWQPPVGDSSVEAGRRLEQVIEGLDSRIKSVIIVAHGGLFSDFLRNRIARQELQAFLPQNTHLTGSLFANCSVTTVIYEPERDDFTIKELASDKHLN
jgi:2,3-bisphosphoglycerate-dependent phosphoglycerate mutase/probable phosphoglycerate mutase